MIVYQHLVHNKTFSFYVQAQKYEYRTEILSITGPHATTHPSPLLTKYPLLAVLDNLAFNCLHSWTISASKAPPFAKMRNQHSKQIYASPFFCLKISEYIEKATQANLQMASREPPVSTQGRKVRLFSRILSLV